jgi:hypothetical protein
MSVDAYAAVVVIGGAGRLMVRQRISLTGGFTLSCWKSMKP